MKKLMSTNYSAAMFNTATLLLRIVFGVMIMKTGYDKLVHFNEMKSTFINFLGMGSTISLILVVFAEFFCGLFLLIGLFSRLASIPLIITMAVALIKVHHSDVFGEGESATLFLGAFLIILLIGPGKASVDGLTGK